ncbi:hypothetical protein Q8F55_008892 [Vanrija albida]|uniref:Arf-GAP domain-containing protein n=1 Tax=Vanrija albida TaxID=181172 RepID=A0ABR3PS44_9TREE
MGSNPPIQAIPFQHAQPNRHIARFLDSIRPYKQEHSDHGLVYFHRSRLGGDVLREEDWNPNAPILPAVLDDTTTTTRRELEQRLRKGKSTSTIKTSIAPYPKADRRRSGSHGPRSPFGHQELAPLDHSTGDSPTSASIPTIPTEIQDGGLLPLTRGTVTFDPRETALAQLLGNRLGIEQSPLGLQQRASARTTNLRATQAQVLAKTRRQQSKLQEPVEPPAAGDGFERFKSDAMHAGAGDLRFHRGGIFARAVASKPVKVVAPPQVQGLGGLADTGGVQIVSPFLETPPHSAGTSAPNDWLSPTSPPNDALAQQQQQQRQPSRLSQIVTTNPALAPPNSAIVMDDQVGLNQPTNRSTPSYPSLAPDNGGKPFGMSVDNTTSLFSPTLGANWFDDPANATYPSQPLHTSPIAPAPYTYGYEPALHAMPPTTRQDAPLATYRFPISSPDPYQQQSTPPLHFATHGSNALNTSMPEPSTPFYT